MDIKTKKFIPKIKRREVAREFYNALSKISNKTLNEMDIYRQITKSDGQSEYNHIDSLVYIPEHETGAGILVRNSGSGIFPVIIKGTEQSIGMAKEALEYLAETEATNLVGLKLRTIKKEVSVL